MNFAEDHIKQVQSRIIKEGLKAGEPIIEYGNHYERIAVTAPGVIIQNGVVKIYGSIKSSVFGRYYYEVQGIDFTVLLL